MIPEWYREKALPGYGIKAMVLDVVAFDRRRVFWAMILTVLASLAEGFGLAMLLPILNFFVQESNARADVIFLGAELSFAAVVALAAVFYICVALLATVLIWRRSIVLSRIQRDFIAALSKRTHAALVRLAPGDIGGRRRNALTHLMTVDVKRAGQSVHFLFSSAGQILRMPALALVAFAMSPPASLAIAVVLVIVVAVARPFDRRARRIGTALIESGAQNLGRGDESIANILLIKTHKAEHRAIDRYDAAVDTFSDMQHHVVAGQATARAVAVGVGSIGAALILWLSLVPLDIDLAEAAVLVVALSRLTPSVVQFHAAWRSMLTAMPSHARVMELLAEAAQGHEPAVPPASGVRGPAAVSLQKISIARVPGAETVLPDITLDLAAGEMTAVTGRSGAGKSTLALGLAGLLPLDGGRVALDGVVLEQRLALRRAAVLVAQDPVLLNDTIAGNLRLAAPDADEAALHDALNAAAADFVSTLPEGIETRIGDRGTRLSGGERQRIALAQALLARPRLLVLDEATSALDAGAEDRVVEALMKLRSMTTIVFITHRRAIAERADTVILLEDRRIITHGPWRDIQNFGAI